MFAPEGRLAMSKETYELLALIARYWFAALALLIVWRGWRAAVQDNRKARTLRDTDPYQRRAKLVRHAASHGFETDLILDRLEE